MCCKSYAANHMLQIICCKSYAANHMLQIICCKSYAANHILQIMCCNSYAANHILQKQINLFVLIHFMNKPQCIIFLQTVRGQSCSKISHENVPNNKDVDWNVLKETNNSQKKKNVWFILIILSRLLIIYTHVRIHLYFYFNNGRLPGWKCGSAWMWWCMHYCITLWWCTQQTYWKFGSACLW